MSDDLRTLAQAVVDATARRDAPGADFGERYRAMRARASARVALIEAMQADDSADGILAALNAADAQGYARAMGEVVEHLDSLSDAAVATYQEHRTEYADGVADGSVEAWQAVRKLAERD